MEAIKQSKDMLSMGVMLTLSGLIGNGSAYLLRVFISATGGLSQVGLYTAGFAIINTYVGLIFSAMATDYFPRLSEVAHSKSKLRETISQQSEIAILILAPILTIFIIFSKWIITILYSSEFIGVAGMIQWASLGMLFKATSWAIAYLFLAKGVSVLFFFNELISSVYVLGFNIIGYKYGGLEGVGISFIFGYLIYLTQVYFLTHFKFSFNFNKKLVRIFFLQFVLIIASFLIINLFNGLYILVGGVIIISFSSAYSIYELDKRVGIRGVLFKKLNNA